MATFRRILVPTDFSPLAAHAAGYARSLAESQGAELHVIHVAALTLPADTAFPAPGMIPAAPPESAVIETRSDVRAGVAEFVRNHFDGLPTVNDVLTGVAYLEICQYAQDHACDLIVIGSHARGMVHRLFLGSVSKAVLEHSPCPLLVVPLKTIESPLDATTHS